MLTTWLWFHRGKLEFRIKVISKEQMPNLANRSQALVPMAYVREVPKKTA